MTAYLAIAFFLSLSSPVISTSSVATADQTQITDAETPNNCSNFDNPLLCEIGYMNHKVARLELLLEVTSLELDTKSLYIENSEKKIDEISHNIHQLESVLSNFKGLPNDEELINALEEEVRKLEIVVRKNDRKLRLLEVRTKEAENSVELQASHVETMANIVSELWFHVQKLEQAHEVIERRTAELRKHIRNHKCYFFKFINNMFSIRHQEMVSAYKSEAVNQLKWSFSALKKYHHQLQGYVKEEIRRNELTAVLAGEELVFFLASAMLVFPLMLALIWLSSLW